MIQEKGVSEEVVVNENSDRAQARRGGRSATNGVVLFTTQSEDIEANQVRETYREIYCKRE
jgi:hypothetical protein